MAIWGKNHHSEKCFCAFCKHERRIYTKKNMSTMNFLLCVVASALMCLALWQKFDPKFFVIFALSLVCTEVFIKMRWRLSLPCPYCGFNPVVYLQDPEKAAQQVKSFLDTKKQDLDFWLRDKNPYKNIKPIKKSSESFSKRV